MNNPHRPKLSVIVGEVLIPVKPGEGSDMDRADGRGEELHA